MQLVKSQPKINILDQFINSFVSDKTKKAYAKDLKDFFEANVGVASPSDLKPFHISYFRDNLTNTGASSATINRKLSTIKSLTKWCIQNGYLTYDPCVSVKAPKVVRVRPTKAFQDVEVSAVLNAAKSEKHKAILMTLFYTGLRRSELVNLKTTDIVNQNGFMGFRVIGKGQKERLVAIPEELKPYLQANSNNTDTKLFDIDESTVYRLVKKYSNKAGLEGFGAHSCRATVISNLLDNGVSLRDVADLAGHSSVNTTMLYDKKRKGLESNAGFKIKY